MALIKTGKKMEKQEQRLYSRDWPGLLAQLADSDPERRRWAARDLSAYPDSVERLCLRLPVEMDVTVRQVILTSLVRIGTPTVVEGLLPFVRSEDASLREAVIDSLQLLPQWLEPPIETLLNDPDSDVRIFAISLMEPMPPDRVLEWITAVLLEDPHINVCAAALNLLAEIGTPEDLPAVDALLQRFSENPFVRFAAETTRRRLQGTGHSSDPESQQNQ